MLHDVVVATNAEATMSECDVVERKTLIAAKPQYWSVYADVEVTSS
jgi:hypothetical protein